MICNYVRISKLIHQNFIFLFVWGKKSDFRLSTGKIHQVSTLRKQNKIKKPLSVSIELLDWRK